MEQVTVQGSRKFKVNAFNLDPPICNSANQKLSKRAHLSKQYPQDTVTEGVTSVTLACIAGKQNLANLRLFEWQTGHGAFSYGQSQIDGVKAYIGNQYNRHKKQSFKEEYLALLDAFQVDYDDNYLFDWLD